MRKSLVFAISALTAFTDVQAHNPVDSLHYKVEMQASLADGNTPLWLNANKYGLSSLEKSNGYFRAAIEKPTHTSNNRKVSLGYGLDMAVAYNFTSTTIVQQAFVEGRWLKGTLTIGSKQQPMELKNSQLSSGSQTLGINARPVPQIRLALADYWTVPHTKGLVSIKGHVAFGKMTDDSWQHEFTEKKSKYADDVIYHSKAGYMKIGKQGSTCPLSLELGLEMASLFGGKIYTKDSDGEFIVYEGGTGFKDFWNVFMPGGSEPNETTYKNSEGDQVGSWLIRVNYDTKNWKLALYADHFFEDHSAMFFLDYDGYGDGEEWNKKKHNRYFMYDLKDMMLGAELNLKRGRWLRDIVFEYIYTKYQSGAVYHDHTPSISDHIGGIDDYYNHSLYAGWQHWGQVMGNPLYRSPIYNTDGKVMVENNRFYAFHLGLGGRPAKGLSYRLLTTYQKGFGTYKKPYLSPKENVNVMIETEYMFSSKKTNGLYIKCGLGADFGQIYGNNRGCQLTIGKMGMFNKK